MRPVNSSKLVRPVNVCKPICPVIFHKIICTVNSNKPVYFEIARPVNSSKLFRPIDFHKSAHLVDSNKLIYPVDVYKSVRPVDACKTACIVGIYKSFFVGYWKYVILFLILLLFAVLVNTNVFNRTILYMIMFINILMTYSIFIKFILPNRLYFIYLR